MSHPYMQKLALTSPTSGGLSVAIVRSGTKAKDLRESKCQDGYVILKATGSSNETKTAVTQFTVLPNVKNSLPKFGLTTVNAKGRKPLLVMSERKHFKSPVKYHKTI
jgi:hypothetical protein